MHARVRGTQSFQPPPVDVSNWRGCRPLILRGRLILGPGRRISRAGDGGGLDAIQTDVVGRQQAGVDQVSLALFRTADTEVPRRKLLAGVQRLLRVFARGSPCRVREAKADRVLVVR